MVRSGPPRTDLEEEEWRRNHHHDGSNNESNEQQQSHHGHTHTHTSYFQRSSIALFLFFLCLNKGERDTQKVMELKQQQTC